MVQRRADSLDRSKFYGVPIAGFEEAGRQQLIFLLMSGLEPNSKLVDLGCGVLRGGYWIIHFLDPGCYHGIESHEQRLEIGRRTILEPSTLEAKRPRFDTNTNFDTGVFGVQFDIFFAYSIWTHASKHQIERMLDNFLRDSAPGAVFLTSILPADWRNPDYQGTRWFGTSHESDVAGCIHHDLQWVGRACRDRNLRMRKVGIERDGQTWLLICRDQDRNLLFRTIWAESRWRRLAQRLRRRLRSA